MSDLPPFDRDLRPYMFGERCQHCGIPLTTSQRSELSPVVCRLCVEPKIAVKVHQVSIEPSAPPNPGLPIDVWRSIVSSNTSR